MPVCFVCVRKKEGKRETESETMRGELTGRQETERKIEEECRTCVCAGITSVDALCASVGHPYHQMVPTEQWVHLIYHPGLPLNIIDSNFLNEYLK